MYLNSIREGGGFIRTKSKFVYERFEIIIFEKALISVVISNQKATAHQLSKFKTKTFSSACISTWIDQSGLGNSCFQTSVPVSKAINMAACQKVSISSFLIFILYYSSQLCSIVSGEKFDENEVVI